MSDVVVLWAGGIGLTAFGTIVGAVIQELTSAARRRRSHDLAHDLAPGLVAQPARLTLPLYNQAPCPACHNRRVALVRLDGRAEYWWCGVCRPGLGRAYVSHTYPPRGA